MKVWAAVAVCLLLVLGVLVVRGDSAAEEEDLRAATESPSEPPVDDAVKPAEVLLTADGMEGMRLGTPKAGLVSPVFGSGPRPVTADDLPAGCMPAYESGYEEARTWDSQAWLVDDTVTAVLITRRNPNLATPAGLDTWLGPALGSPIEAAEELPGARTRTERPTGAQGPEVTVVVVPADGVEVVFSDIVFDLRAVPEQARGRVTTIEVRLPRARACSQEALSEFSPVTLEETAADTAISLDGVTGAPIGSDAAVVRDLPGVHAQNSGLEGCEAFLLSAGHGLLRVVAVDGVVASASVWGDVSEDSWDELPFRIGMSAEEVSAAIPEGAEPVPAASPEAVEVRLGKRLVRVDLAPPWRWVEDVEIPVSGGPPVVHTITVQDAEVDPGKTSC